MMSLLIMFKKFRLKAIRSFNILGGGATWLFSSQENHDKFKKNPTEFAPQYGGYCAFGVANNYKASVNPKAWSIEGGKLYLNFSLGVRSQWLDNKKSYIKKGDVNWPSLKNSIR